MPVTDSVPDDNYDGDDDNGGDDDGGDDDIDGDDDGMMMMIMCLLCA